MTPSSSRLRAVCPALLAWALLESPATAQSPAIGGGIGSANYGAANITFGATGYGARGSYGRLNRFSLGISGGGGGDYGAPNRYGRYSAQNARDLDSILPTPYPEENVAHLRVIVPTEAAQLWVNDTPMKKQGLSRSFISPFLTPGKHFQYDLKVRYLDSTGRSVERLRTVTVHAGSQDIVDFTRIEGAEHVVSRSRPARPSPNR